MTPGDDPVVVIERDLDPLYRGGVIEAVANVVLAGPLYLDRSADLLADQRRFDDIVALRLPSEAAAQEGDVHLDVRRVHPERCRDVLARGGRRLHRRPEFGSAARDACHRGQGLHRRMDEVSLRVLPHKALRRRCEGGIDIALLAQDLTRLAGGLAHFRHEGSGVVVAVRSVVPIDLECIATFDGRIGIARNDGDPA